MRKQSPADAALPATADAPPPGPASLAAVDVLEGLDHITASDCACPVVAAFVRRANDRLPDEARPLFLPYLDRLATAVPGGHEPERARWAAWRATSGAAASAMAAIGFERQAESLRRIAPDDWIGARTAAQIARATAAPRSSEAARAAAWASEAAAWAYVGAHIWAAEASAMAAAWAAQAEGDDGHWDIVTEILDGMLAIGDGA